MRQLRAILDQLAFLARSLMRVIRFLVRHIFALLFVVVFSMATVTIPAVFNVVSSITEFAFEIVGANSAKDTTVRKRIRATNAELAETRVDNVMLKASADFEARESDLLRTNLAQQSEEVVSLRREAATSLAEADGLKRRVATLEAEKLVSFDGKMVPTRQAVSETASRVSRRVTASTSRNIGSMGAEALPWIGIGVVATATAWEVKDACELMKDMHKLDVAFNPENAIDDGGVCGMEVPSREELWDAVKSSPRAAWDRAGSYYGSLGEISFEEMAAKTTDWSSGSLRAVQGWFEADPE